MGLFIRFLDAGSQSVCDHCGAIAEIEINGEDPNSLHHKAYLKTCRSYCKYCEIMDPKYYNDRRIWCCYRTLKMGGDIKKAYKEMSPNSADGYFKNTNGYI